MRLVTGQHTGFVGIVKAEDTGRARGVDRILLALFPLVIAEIAGALQPFPGHRVVEVAEIPAGVPRIGAAHLFGIGGLQSAFSV